MTQPEFLKKLRDYRGQFDIMMSGCIRSKNFKDPLETMYDHVRRTYDQPATSGWEAGALMGLMNRAITTIIMASDFKRSRLKKGGPERRMRGQILRMLGLHEEGYYKKAKTWIPRSFY